MRVVDEIPFDGLEAKELELDGDDGRGPKPIEFDLDGTSKRVLISADTSHCVPNEIGSVLSILC